VKPRSPHRHDHHPAPVALDRSYLPCPAAVAQEAVLHGSGMLGEVVKIDTVMGKDQPSARTQRPCRAARHRRRRAWRQVI